MMMDTIATWWHAACRRLSGWAEQLSAWLHPGWRIAPLTTGRVMEFHDFLRDAGFDDTYEALGAGAEGAAPGGSPAGLGALADEMQGGPDSAVDDKTAREVAGQLRARIIEEGRLVELNQILFDVSEAEAREIPTDVVEAVFANFLIGWLRHLTQLMGTAGATTSQPAETETG